MLPLNPILAAVIVGGLALAIFAPEKKQDSEVKTPDESTHSNSRPKPKRKKHTRKKAGPTVPPTATEPKAADGNSVQPNE